MKTTPQQEFEILFSNYPELSICRESIFSAYLLLQTCYRNKGLIMTCGNGGSAADAEHMVGELMKGFKQKRPLAEQQQQTIRETFPEEADFFISNLQQAIPVLSLVSQLSLTSAFMNDVHPEMIYAQQVIGYGKPGDVLIGLSTSGNSANVVNACKTAKAFGIKTIAFTGSRKSALHSICDITIQVPAQEVFRIQEYHLPIYHTLCSMLEAYFFNK
ncbi:MAG: SIS domain-containing protein [Tannerellaceae bacterium]|nr:SIS domain-containing protein [Tannerellaceae bacterium]